MSNVLNYNKVGGAETVIGGVLKVVDGGQLLLEDGASVQQNLANATAVSNAITTTANGGVLTTESLSTAFSATQVITINKAGVVATDRAMATLAGGTNTRKIAIASTVCGTGTITVTLRNDELSNALNGTVKFCWDYAKVAV